MKSKPGAVIFLFFFLFVLSSAASPAGFGRYEGPGVLIRYDLPLRNAAAALAAVYPKIRADLESKLGSRVTFVPTVDLIRTSSVFHETGMSDLVTAYAVPARNVIVIDYSKMERTPFDLRSTFEHELCHLLLHRMIQTAEIPRWLDEGIAQWASGGIADIVNPGEKDLLKQAVLSHGLLPLAYISAGFPEDRRGTLLAYEESRSFIDFIVREYGQDRLRGVLRAMQNGSTVESATAAVLSTGMPALEERWQAGLMRKYSWSSYISNNIYWLLFFAAGLATFIGYLRLRSRMKNYRDEEDEDYPDDNPDL